MEENTSNSEIITSFEKNRTETIVFSLNEFKGKMLTDIRVYARLASREEPTPTRKGVSLPVEKWPELYNAIKALENFLTVEGQAAEIAKSASQVVRVSTRMYREKMLMDIRVMAKYGGAEEFRFTDKGVSMSVELIDDLLSAAGKMDAAVGELG